MTTRHVKKGPYVFCSQSNPLVVQRNQIGCLTKNKFRQELDVFAAAGGGAMDKPRKPIPMCERRGCPPFLHLELASRVFQTFL